MMFDKNSNVEVAESLRPAVHSANTDGQVVDLRGAESATILVTVGAIVGASGNGQIILKEGDLANGSDAVAVADAAIIGAEPTALTANSVHQFGYIGSKRYVRVSIDKGGETSIAASGVVLKGHLNRMPYDASYAS